jgi:hypothetical protein
MSLDSSYFTSFSLVLKCHVNHDGSCNFYERKIRPKKKSNYLLLCVYKAFKIYKAFYSRAQASNAKVPSTS